MGSISKLQFSEYTYPVVIDETESPGTQLHFASSSTNVLDEVWLYVSNTDTVDHIVHLYYDDGGNQEEEQLKVPANNQITAIAGIPYNTMSLYVFCDSGAEEKLIATGFVNRIDQS